MTKWSKKEQKEHRKEWAEALRSGDYKQGFGCLHSGDLYCCLGVACDLFKNKYPDELEITLSEHIFYYGVSGSILPGIVKDYYGINSIGSYETSSLLDDNDDNSSFLGNRNIGTREKADANELRRQIGNDEATKTGYRRGFRGSGHNANLQANC